MMNHNSRKAYEEIKQDGTLAKREAEVLKIIRYHGPINGRQIDDFVPGGHKRVRALLDTCAVFGVTKKDPITGKDSWYYSTTGQEPLLKQPCVKKPKYKNDPAALSHLYDKAFEAGIRFILDRLGYTSQAIEQELAIMEAQK